MYDVGEIRRLCRYLVDVLPRDDVSYVDIVLGGFDKALEADPVALFLLLLECFVKYVQHLTMIYDIGVMFKALNLRPVLDLGHDQSLDVLKFVDRYGLGEVYRLYKDLFRSPSGIEVLKDLISRVRDERLRERFRRFFLGEGWYG